MIISAFIFSLLHVPRDLLSFIEKLCVGGVYYSFIYCQYKNVLLLILIHIAHNFYIVLWQMYSKEDNCNG